MDHGRALRLAITATEGVSVGQATVLVQEYLSQLARCPMCQGEHGFTFKRDIEIDQARIVAGTSGMCPYCADGAGDPDYVVWHCARGDFEEKCRRGDRRSDHLECGWRILIPLDLVKTDDRPWSGAFLPSEN